MAEFIQRDFRSRDLIKVDESKLVMLASGGPLMEIESITDGVAICFWHDDKGERKNATFPVVCLRKLVRFKSP